MRETKMHEQQQDLDKTEKNQPLEPEPKGEGSVRLCGVRCGAYVCVSPSSHLGRHKYRRPGKGDAPPRRARKAYVGTVPLADAASVASEETGRVDEALGTSRLRRNLVGVSVQFTGGTVGMLHLPIPFSAADIECVRRFCDYLDDAFADDFAEDAAREAAAAAPVRDADWREQGRVGAEQADPAIAVDCSRSTTKDVAPPPAGAA